MARPAKQLSPRQIQKLASEGATNIEIADFFEVSPDTIERRFAGDLRKGRANRNTSLRKVQIKAAHQGNSSMLVWLGKQYLGQSDSMIDQCVLEAIKTAGLTKEDLVELIQKKDVLAAAKPKKTFELFCECAGYPLPFKKQLEMREFGMVDTDPRLLLGSRGYGKTDYVTIMGVAYDIYENGPLTSNLLITKSKARNASITNEIASALKANGVSLEIENSSCIRVRGKAGKDHSFEAITIKTSMRGRHPNRIIMDDPVTEEDTSPAMRVLVKKKYDEAYKLSKNILIIGQPAHADDLYAELRPRLKKLEVPHGSIPELDADLEAMKLAGIDPVSIEMSYHLRIPIAGSMPFANIKYLDKMPPGDSVAFIDPSDGGDYTAVSAIQGYMQGVAVEGRQFKRAWYHCLDEMIELFKKCKVRKVCFETNATGSQPIAQLRDALKHLGIGVVGVHSNSNKEAVIMQAGSFAHHIHLSKESDAGYTKHVTKYEPNAEYDDAPDSLARGLEWIGLIRGKK